MSSRIIAFFGSIFVLSSLFVVGCLIDKKHSDNVTPSGGGIYFAGSFQGTLLLSRSRVRAAPASAAEAQQVVDPRNVDKKFGPTDLVVAKLNSNGDPEWSRSFTRLVAGRAVLRLPPTDQGVIVVGVFQGSIEFDLKDQKLGTSGQHQGVFAAHLSPTGQVNWAAVAAVGSNFASPELVNDAGQTVVSVPYDGVAIQDGKPLPPGPGHLRFAVRFGTRIQTLPPKTTAMNSTHGKPNAESGGEFRSASARMGGFCNVCILHVAKTDPDCSPCRTNVASFDSYCRDTDWDILCMNEAMDDLTCSPSIRECVCPHDTCTLGDFLHVNCTVGRGGSSLCVNEIDSLNYSCGHYRWGTSCRNENANCINYCPCP